MSRLVLVLVSAGIGALITWWLRAGEAQAKELGDCVGHAVDELAAVEQAALAIWGEPQSSETAGDVPLAKMKTLEARLHRLARLIDFVGSKVTNFERYETDRLLGELRIACTDDGAGATYSSPPPLRVLTILNRGTDLLLELRKVHRDVLPRSGIRRLLRQLGPVSDEQESRRYWSNS